MAEHTVQDEEFNLAVQVIYNWHKERDLSFAILNSGSIFVARYGKPLTIESMLNHAHKIAEGENAIQIHSAMAAAEASNQARAGKVDGAAQ